MAIEQQDVERAMNDLKAALEDPRNAKYADTIQNAIELLRPKMCRHRDTHLDDIDAAAVEARRVARAKRARPLVGDLVRLPDGELRRITYCMPNSVQLTWPKIARGSFYLCRDGLADYSGPLDYPIPANRIHWTEGRALADFWMFRHEEAKAHNGVTFDLEVPVWEYRPD